MNDSNTSNMHSKKNRFSKKEDEKLESLVKQWGTKNWKVVASKLEN
jgi:hypothetical protein